jgi:hypothetical protein
MALAYRKENPGASTKLHLEPGKVSMRNGTDGNNPLPLSPPRCHDAKKGKNKGSIYLTPVEKGLAGSSFRFWLK